MSDWDERDFRPEDEEEAYEAALPREPPSSRLAWSIWTVVVLIVVFGATLLYQRTRRPPEAPQLGQAPIEEVVQTANPADELTGGKTSSRPLPALSGSDAFVRGLLAALTAHPSLTMFFVDEGLVRKAVAIIVNVSEGDDPARHFRHLAPEDPFDVVRRRSVLYIDPLSYRRYDALAAGVASVDARRVAELYRRVEPLLVEAYGEMGYLEQPFEVTLTRAIHAVLRTPIVEGRIEVHAVSVNYAFTDRRLEQLQPAQKLLLRMGPQNARTIQSKLREFATALDLAL